MQQFLNVSVRLSVSVGAQKQYLCISFHFEED